MTIIFKSIYKTIKNDFSFLQEFGFWYLKDLHHYVTPSVVFESQISEIQIGMNYADKKIYVIFFEDKNYLFYGTEILENVQLQGDTYEKQLYQVINIVIDYLSENCNK